MEDEDRERLKRRLQRYHQHHDVVQSRYDNYSNAVNEDQRTLTQSLHRRWLESQAPKKLKMIVSNEESVEAKGSSLPADHPVVVNDGDCVASDNFGSTTVKSANIPSSDTPTSPRQTVSEHLVCVHTPRPSPRLAEPSSQTSRASPKAERAKTVKSDESSHPVLPDLASTQLLAYNDQHLPCDQKIASSDELDVVTKTGDASSLSEPCPDLPHPATFCEISPPAAVEIGTETNSAPWPDLLAT